MGVDDDIVTAIREKRDPADTKLAALRQFTLSVVRQRGQVSAEAQSEFFAAGYSNQQVLEIILVLAQKVMSNYVNHVADTPLDAPFQQFA